MSKGISPPTRVSKEFKEWARSIAKKRYIRGIDKQELKLPRITKAITRVPRLKEILEEARIDV